jgi:hypothetical protein
MTMIAPSPDWFTGFIDLTPISQNDNTWWKSFTVYSDPFDVGSDAGTTYDAPNAPLYPLEPVTRITSETASPFVTDGAVLPVASWTFTLKQK